MSRAIIAGIAFVAVGAAAVGAVFARRRRRATQAAEPPPARREWRCTCGQEYLVAGQDRHRIYWVAGATPDDPLLEEHCVRCGAALPVQD
jgi:hypothetical protein